MKIRFDFEVNEAKVLGTEMCKKLQERLAEITYSTETKEILWMMTYSSDEAAEAFGFSTEELNEEKIEVIRNIILRISRKIFDNFNFGNGSAYDEKYGEVPAYRQLKRALQNDVYALSMVVEKCEEAAEYMDIEAIQKVLHCFFASRYITSRIKAFDLLGFKMPDEQNYLMNSRYAIACFLKYLSRERLENVDNSSKHELPESQSEETPENPDYKIGLTADEIIKYKEEIKKMYAYLFSDIDKMLDWIKWLYENRPKIEALIRAYEQI